jgi:hypothetical protein
MAHSVPQVGCEDLAELTQDAIVIAAALLSSAEARGKKVSAGNISYYAVKLIRQGRRSTGQSKTDVLHPGSQIKGRSQLISLDAPLVTQADGEETLCLHEVLACRSEDPAMAATRRLDWEQLVTLLDSRAREVLKCLLEDQDLTALVPKLKRSRSAIQTDKDRLAGSVREHLGADILLRAQDQPRWRDNVHANRERAACRHQWQSA